MKTLGVLWSPSEDEFKYQVHQPGGDHSSTKRTFLKMIATLFDPLGFLAPYIIRAKIILQEMWESGVDWDDSVEESLSRKAQQWFEELSELPRLCVPRCLRGETGVRSITLHTFVDTSQEAYGAATYTRTPIRGWNDHLSSSSFKIKGCTPSSCHHPSPGLNGCIAWTQTCLDHRECSKHPQT